MSATLEQLAELVRRESGIRVKPAQHATLTAALKRALPAIPAAEFLRIAADPGAAAIAMLIEQVTVKETSFLRDSRQLDAIDWHGLLERAKATGSDTIRVWSAACATGEEAYTLALLACEAFAPAAPPVRILGTDIAASALATAAEGRYRGRAVRALSPALRSRYLVGSEDEFVVGERLRGLVSFARHNLVQDRFPPLGEAPFDVIVCRNVLIYFGSESIPRLLGDLERALAADGTLILGAADTLCGTSLRLAALEGPEPVERPVPSDAPMLRRPLGRVPARGFEDRLADALGDAGAGRTAEALTLTALLLEEQPLNADVYFVRGLVALETGEAAAAVASFRRSLYIDPTFCLAAFQLGRAHDALREGAPARRAYEQALRSLPPEDDRHELMLEQVDLADVAGACRARIASLR